MQITTTDGKTFTLTRETAADHQLIDALDHERTVHVVNVLRDSSRNERGGFENTGAVLSVDRASEPALRYEAARQALSALRNLVRLALGEAAQHGLSGTLPTNPQAQEQLTTGLVQLQVVLETLSEVVIQHKLVSEEMQRAHSGPLAVETPIVEERQMPNTQKFCKDCKHYDTANHTAHVCTHPSLGLDQVIGKPIRWRCEGMRRRSTPIDFGAIQCGLDGLLFEPADTCSKE